MTDKRDAAFWRDLAGRLAEALDGVRCYANDARTGHLIDRDTREPVNNEMATEDCQRMNAALHEYEEAAA